MKRTVGEHLPYPQLILSSPRETAVCMSDNVMLLSDNYIDLAGPPKSVVIYSKLAKQTFRSSCCALFNFRY